jgi:hypothetical protein
MLGNVHQHAGMRSWVALSLLVLLDMSSPSSARTIVSVDRRDCSQLTRHTPSADVAYKSGVDARGRAVAPANIGGDRPVVLPDRFEIPITVDLGDRLGIPPSGDADYIAEFPVGAVTVTADGRVVFNGVPLTDDEAAELSALCQQIDGN